MRQRAAFRLAAKGLDQPVACVAAIRFGRRMPITEGRDRRPKGFPSHREGFDSRHKGFPAHREGFGSRQKAFPPHHEGFHSRQKGFLWHREGIHARQKAFPSPCEGFDAGHAGTLRFASPRPSGGKGWEKVG